MKKMNLALVALLTIATLGAGVASAETNETGICQADAKVCPNGTSVGRTGPNCEFVCGTTGEVKPLLKPVPMPINFVPGASRVNDGRAYTGGTPCFDEATGVNRCKEVRQDINTARKDIRASTTQIRKDVRIEMKDNRAEMEARAKDKRVEVEKKRAEIKDEQQKKRLEIARKQTELVTRRLEAAIERVQKLSDRVSERLTKLEANGVNTTVSRGHIAEAKTKLDEARTKTAAVKLAVETALASATASSTPKDAMKNVQSLVKDTANTIQEAHRHVALSISTIKPGINKPRPATTTATTTQ